MKEKLRNPYIDNLRAVAITAVIALHIAAPPVVNLFDKYGAKAGWWTANFYDSLCRFCVPVFIMITGALLLPQVIGLREFLHKRLNRILIPFIFWSLVYLIFSLIAKERVEGTISFINVITWIGIQFIQGTAVHLWYVYMLIGLYLFIPIIKPWVQTASNKALLYFLIIWIITLIFNQQTILEFDTSFDISNFGGFTGYLILGYYLAHRLILNRKTMLYAGVLFLVGFLITISCTFYLSKKNGSFTEDFYDYLTINVMMMSAGIFILFKGWQPNLNPRIAALRDTVSQYGFGIYLNHVLILTLLSYYHFTYEFINPIFSVPVLTVVCLSISTLLVYLTKRLPYGKYISG
jgi:surface polysaccharide O-acyltransferase-like enzyme